MFKSCSCAGKLWWGSSCGQRSLNVQCFPLGNYGWMWRCASGTMTEQCDGFCTLHLLYARCEHVHACLYQCVFVALLSWSRSLVSLSIPSYVSIYHCKHGPNFKLGPCLIKTLSLATFYSHVSMANLKTISYSYCTCNVEECASTPVTYNSPFTNAISVYT